MADLAGFLAMSHGPQLMITPDRWDILQEKDRQRYGESLPVRPELEGETLEIKWAEWKRCMTLCSIREGSRQGDPSHQTHGQGCGSGFRGLKSSPVPEEKGRRIRKPCGSITAIWSVNNDLADFINTKKGRSAFYD